MSTDALTWFKSSRSGTQGDDCIEVTVAADAVHVRDSKDLTRRPFSVGRERWARFLAHATTR